MLKKGSKILNKPADPSTIIVGISLINESGRAPLVRAWDSRGFTPSPEPTKCAFRGGEVSSNPKKKI